MLGILMNSFGLAFVLVTGLLLVLLAIGGILVAGMSARDYFRSRYAEPMDWYNVTIPELPRRAIDAKRLSRARGQQRQVVVLDAGVPVEEAYLQEELPF